MGYEELLDGDEHWLELDAWPGWVLPSSVTVELVRVETVRVDPLEAPVCAVVSAPLSAAEVAGRFADGGWPQASLMIQRLCELLELPVEVEQIVKRDSSWAVVEKWQRVLAGSRGRAGGDLLDADEIAALTEGL